MPNSNSVFGIMLASTSRLTSTWRLRVRRLSKRDRSIIYNVRTVLSMVRRRLRQNPVDRGVRQRDLDDGLLRIGRRFGGRCAGSLQLSADGSDRRIGRTRFSAQNQHMAGVHAVRPNAQLGGESIFLLHLFLGCSGVSCLWFVFSTFYVWCCHS